MSKAEKIKTDIENLIENFGVEVTLRRKTLVSEDAYGKEYSYADYTVKVLVVNKGVIEDLNTNKVRTYGGIFVLSSADDGYSPFEIDEILVYQSKNYTVKEVDKITIEGTICGYRYYCLSAEDKN